MRFSYWHVLTRSIGVAPQKNCARPIWGDPVFRWWPLGLHQPNNYGFWMFMKFTFNILDMDIVLVCFSFVYMSKGWFEWNDPNAFLKNPWKKRICPICGESNPFKHICFPNIWWWQSYETTVYFQHFLLKPGCWWHNLRRRVPLWLWMVY